MKTRTRIEDLLRRKIAQRGRSVNSLAKASGVLQPALWRFIHHRQGLNLRSVQKLADYFDLELRPVPVRWVKW
jgi:hypothetical protein